MGDIAHVATIWYYCLSLWFINVIRKNMKSNKRNEYEYQIITICLKLFIVEYF